jgi:hypothetical protein
VLAKDPSLRYESAGQFVATMVASQIWGAKLNAYQASTVVRRPSGGLVKRLQCKLSGPKAVARLALAALLITTIFVFPNFHGRELSLAQIQKHTVAQADYLSAVLMGFFDSPQTTTFWQTYGDPVVNVLSPEELQMHMQPYTKNIQERITAFKDPNGWVQRTWRYWNQIKLSQLFN